MDAMNKAVRRQIEAVLVSHLKAQRWFHVGYATNP